MKYKIIATDLDKTLLGEDRRVSPENWAAIRRLTEMGVHVVPASGRSYEEMPKELVESDLIRYFITSDGTTVYDKKTDTTHELAMSRSLGHHVLDKVYSYPVCVMLHADTRSYVDIRTHNPEDYAAYNMNAYWVNFAMEMEAPVEDLKGFSYRLPAIQMVAPFFKNIEDLKECKAYFEKDPRLIVAQADPFELEIFDATAGKGNALMLLAKLLGVDGAATVAVGDSTNDSTMVQAAGLGLAMENAVPELKAVADGVICHHRDHCLQYILEHYFS